MKRITSRSQRAAARAVPQFMTATEIASRLRVSRAWVHQLYASGRLAGQIIGRVVGSDRGGVLRFREDDVEAFLNGNGGGGAT